MGDSGYVEVGQPSEEFREMVMVYDSTVTGDRTASCHPPGRALDIAEDILEGVADISEDDEEWERAERALDELRRGDGGE